LHDIRLVDWNSVGDETGNAKAFGERAPDKIWRRESIRWTLVVSIVNTRGKAVGDSNGV
jgi:hypothetical protein